MPELPEVETIRRTLVPHLLGQVVRQVRLLTPSVWRGQDPAKVAGKRVASLDRRGKHLLIFLSPPPPSPGSSEPVEMVLHVHLGMTGRLIFVPRTEEPGAHLDPEEISGRHVHAVFAFDRGELCFWDQRRFGYLELLRADALESHPRLRLGPEPLDEEFMPSVLQRMLAGRRAPVKAVLLDQHILAGVGNIYADEALHRAGVNPLRPAGELKPVEVEALRHALQQVLQEAIAARGTTFSDYRDGEGQPGEFVSRLRVYGREGEPCPRCGAAIARQRFGGRSTYFCPRCQK